MLFKHMITINQLNTTTINHLETTGVKLSLHISAVFVALTKDKI